jgi:hypothetical protein
VLAGLLPTPDCCPVCPGKVLLYERQQLACQDIARYFPLWRRTRTRSLVLVLSLSLFLPACDPRPAHASPHHHLPSFPILHLTLPYLSLSPASGVILITLRSPSWTGPVDGVSSTAGRTTSDRMPLHPSTTYRTVHPVQPLTNCRPGIRPSWVQACAVWLQPAIVTPPTSPCPNCWGYTTILYVLYTSARALSATGQYFCTVQYSTS